MQFLVLHNTVCTQRWCVPCHSLSPTTVTVCHQHIGAAGMVCRSIVEHHFGWPGSQVFARQMRHGLPDLHKIIPSKAAGHSIEDCRPCVQRQLAVWPSGPRRHE
jgi:hypothetical protein